MDKPILIVHEPSAEFISGICHHLQCDPSELILIDAGDVLKSRHIGISKEACIIGHHAPIDPVIMYHKSPQLQVPMNKPKMKTKQCVRHQYMEHINGDKRYWQCNCGKFLL